MKSIYEKIQDEVISHLKNPNKPVNLSALNDAQIYIRELELEQEKAAFRWEKIEMTKKIERVKYLIEILSDGVRE